MATPTQAQAATQAAKPSEAIATAKPAATSPEKPAAASPDKPAAAPADWEATWKATVEAAKKEGKVAVAGGPGPNFRDGVMAFQKAYPDIKLEFTGASGSDFAPKVIAERQGGQYLWDVHLGGASTMNGRLKPAGVLAPVKPVLLLPEVLDGGKWLGGMQDSWMDKEGQYAFAFSGRLTEMFVMNRDFVPESELSKNDQLLEPKWKGKIVTQQMFSPGPSVGWLYLVKGEEWLRKFYSQDLAIVNDARTQIEGLVRGRYPIAFGADRNQLLSFKKEGLGLNVKLLEPNSEASIRLTGGFGYLAMIDKAPHPNAAKVFINYLLSKEGQKAYVQATGDNSRRLDVDGPPDTAANPNTKYRLLEREDLYPNVARANEIAKEVIKWR